MSEELTSESKQRIIRSGSGYSYEALWLARKQFMEKLIEEGETNALRVIKKMENFERFNALACNIDEFKKTGSFEANFYPLPLPEGKDDPNVIMPKNFKEPVQIKRYGVLPTGTPIGERQVFINDYQLATPYTSCDVAGFIIDYIRDKQFDAIIELGAGFSQNLFKLHYFGGPLIPYYGGDYTQSGTDCARLLARLEPRINLTNFVFDFNAPNFDAISQYKSVLVFTSHTIEQVEVLSEKSLPAIARLADHVTCIHFEPFGYQIGSDANEVDMNHKQLFFQKRWNKNLFQRLVGAHIDGDIDVSFIGKNIYGSFDNGLNPTSIALWQSAKQPSLP